MTQLDMVASTETHTEATMAELLRRRYTFRGGNGQRYVHATGVRNAASFYADRTCDFIAVDLWPSTGMPIHGHEIKVSRSDWLREMRDPTKAEAFRPYMDFWWLAVSDPAIVKPGELPEGWGLLVAAGGGLRAKVKAPKNPDVKPMSRGRLAALMRAIDKHARAAGECRHVIGGPS